MLCSVSCTLVLEEWTNSLWINKGIFIFFLDLNCLTCFLLECQWVLNNSCRQSLILPSPLLRAGTPGSDITKPMDIGAAPVTAQQSEMSLWEQAWHTKHHQHLHILAGGCAEGQRACGGLCAGEEDWQVLTPHPFTITGDRVEVWKEDRGHWLLWDINLIAISASRTILVLVG